MEDWKSALLGASVIVAITVAFCFAPIVICFVAAAFIIPFCLWFLYHLCIVLGEYLIGEYEDLMEWRK